MDIKDIEKMYGKDIATHIMRMERGETIHAEEKSNEIISAIDDYDWGSIEESDEIVWGTETHMLYFARVGSHYYIIEDLNDGYAIIEGPVIIDDYYAELAKDRVRRVEKLINNIGRVVIVAYWKPAEGSNSTAVIKLYKRGNRLRAKVEYGISDSGRYIRFFSGRPEYYDVQIQEIDYDEYRPVEKGTMIIAPNGIFLPDDWYKHWEIREDL